jgi:hypothetical protein
MLTSSCLSAGRILPGRQEGRQRVVAAADRGRACSLNWLFKVAGQQCPGGGGVVHSGQLRDPEHGRQVQRVAAAGQRLVELTVDAHLLQRHRKAAEAQVAPPVADRTGLVGGLLADEQVPVGGVREAGVALIKPGQQQAAGQLIQRPGVPAAASASS